MSINTHAEDFLRISNHLDSTNVQNIFADTETISFDHIKNDTLPFDKWDWIMIVVSGCLGALCDFIIGTTKG